MTRRRIIKFSALVSALSGFTILIASVWPILEYQLTEARAYSTLLTPLILDKEVKNDGSKDFTKASNWFPDAPYNNDFSSSKVSFYTVSIPKLKIEDAVVA